VVNYLAKRKRVMVIWKPVTCFLLHCYCFSSKIPRRF